MFIPATAMVASENVPKKKKVEAVTAFVSIEVLADRKVFYLTLPHITYVHLTACC